MRNRPAVLALGNRRATVAEWAGELGLTPSGLYSRLARGIPRSVALTEPRYPQGRRAAAASLEAQAASLGLTRQGLFARVKRYGSLTAALAAGPRRTARLPRSR